VPDLNQARQALGVRLRGMRRDAGLTGKDLAARLGWLPSKISKIETGQQTPTADDLRHWTDALGRSGELVELVQQVHALESFYAPWRRQLRPGMQFRQAEAARLEEAARLIRAYEPNYIPGILQTPGYARGRLEQGAALYDAPRNIDEALQVRLDRQRFLERPTKGFRFVVAEAALIQGNAVGTKMMADQIRHLLRTSVRSNVHLGLVPRGVVWPVHADHGFWCFDEKLVLVETLSAELRLTQAAEIALYLRAFDALEAVAVHGTAARDIMLAAARDMDRS
jgi:transcriptional regulator with XRE-family HTH domain